MSKTTHDLEAERQLIERAKNDASAFGEIFDMYYPAILNYVIRRTGNVAIAQDITSEVFISALNGLPKFKWQGVPISAWLYKIATNELRMHYRKSRHTTSLDEMYETIGFEPVDDKDIEVELQAAQEHIERQRNFRRAQALIAQLPLKYQEVIALRFGEQKKIQEIAEILGKREGTIKSLLSRGLKRLRTGLEQQNMQPDQRKRIMSDEGRTNIFKPQDEYE